MTAKLIYKDPNIIDKILKKEEEDNLLAYQIATSLYSLASLNILEECLNDATEDIKNALEHLEKRKLYKRAIQIAIQLKKKESNDN